MDDLVETIKALELSLDWLPATLTPEERQHIREHWLEHAQRMRAEQDRRERQLFAAYRRLSPEQGREVALYALELFDTDTDYEEYLPHKILGHVANYVPGALKGLYGELIKREIFWTSEYREADPLTRDQLLRLLEEDVQDSLLFSHIMASLAWIGDEAVQAQFHHWRQHPPHSFPNLSPRDYANIAGWELTEESHRRDLFYQTCYELIPISQATPEAIPGPVDVIAPHEEQCHWCGLHMTTLFDLDLRDPRLAFLGLQGERLRIAMCERCIDPIFTDVDLHGGSRWSAANPLTPQIDSRGWEIGLLPQHQLALGPARRTPYETVGTYQRAGISQIGGHPEWAQDARYPRCPDCQRTLPCIGQLSTRDVDEDAEGIYYAFLCADCGKATTGYQQT